MPFGLTASSGPIYGYLVIPVDGAFLQAQLSDSARQLVQAAARLAHGRMGGPVETLAVNTRMQRLWRCGDGTAFPLAHLARQGMHILMNTGFLLSDSPPLAALIRETWEKHVTWCGARSCRDTHACAFTAGWLTSSLRPRRLWQALRHLTACTDDDVEDVWKDVTKRPLMAPRQSSVENSPAMCQVTDAVCKRWLDSPRFLNTAFKEIMSTPQSDRVVAGDAERMAEALARQ